ncbi:MAG: hypothetical protein MMC33_001525 [Icmadophila ericetorum]|nr:hypothetical protein [Icmadophila ericetorum]
MLHIMDHITDKPDWAIKVFDEEVSKKWKDEAMATEGRHVTQKMADWIIDELKFKAEIFQKTGVVSIYNGDVVKSDIAVSEVLKDRLKTAAIRLEDIPFIEKDFHPGSDGKVLDLVHPSLFPLVFGRSRILSGQLVHLDDCVEKCGEGETIRVPYASETICNTRGDSRYKNQPYSQNFQWLPCEVDLQGGLSSEAVSTETISSGLMQAKITSYINNLHPERHKDLYAVVEEIIARAIPLWNATLTPLDPGHSSQVKPRISYKNAEWDPDPEDNENRRAIQPEPKIFPTPKESSSDISQEKVIPAATTAYDFYREEPYEPRAELTVDIVQDYGDRGLQIIVKLANIHLTPDKPEYEGGAWHVEGMLNEHICATALYYYDNHNISESRLAFRQLVDEEPYIDYEQDYDEWLTEIFGLNNYEAAVQEVGDILCKEGRLLTFPNLLQHRVKPFRLEDPSKPGHRKILALFLVDPKIRIVSTANVPPQQRHWWRGNILSSTSKLTDLSAELQNQIFEDVDDFPIGMDEAKELRLELMDERKEFVVTHNKCVERITFSLCEH